MEEWILLVMGLSGGVPDFKVMVQIQSSKWAKAMVEALTHGGFDKLLGPIKTIKVFRKNFCDGYSHRHVEVSGLEVKGQRVNDFWIYIQLPNNNAKTADLAVQAMLDGKGLRVHLGPFCKNITFYRKSETHIAAFEELGAGIIVS